MTEHRIPARAEEIFFEIHRDNPREGPGSFKATRNAYSALSNLPDKPIILDIGCGPGQQTMDLATLSAGTIYAIDNDVPFLKTKYQNDAEAREVIANEVLEIDLFRKYSDDYGYVFYFMQKQ